ncbi:NAD-dependent epimerase/dehydratase family protein [Gymnodinialimonas phycosphaerae]
MNPDSGVREVLVLGADGFIGRHIAFHLRAEGWDVLA